MSEIQTNNNWWKLEDSWKRIAKILPLLFTPFIGAIILLIGVALLLFPIGSIAFWGYRFIFRLFNVLFIVSLIVIFIGLIPYFILYANQIGNAIKLNKIKKTLPEEPEYRKIFAYYIVGFIAPVVGPFFWSKSINNIMKYLGTQISIQGDIDYVENRGKKYAILGMTLWISFWASYIFYYIMRFLSLMDKVVITREFLDFLIIFFSIFGGIMLILDIIMVAIQIGIIRRLTNSIHKSGLTQ